MRPIPLSAATRPISPIRFCARIYSGTAAFGTLHVAPMLTIDVDEGEPKPVKTIPSHFMPVEIATSQDVNDVFGQEDATHFKVGEPLDMEGRSTST